MKVFRDLYIHGNPAQIATLIQEVEHSLAEGWRRDKEQEASLLRQFPVRQQDLYCFSWTQEGSRPAASVFLTEKHPGIVFASNILSRANRQLSYDEYNAILEEFCERFVRPAADKAALAVELTSDHADLDRWLSGATAKKLRDFSALANKYSGSSHASDRERWNDFLLAADQEKSSLDASTLRRWLIEVESWPQDVAERLASEYEFSRVLLDFAAQRGA